jgi:hypothetical protein
MNAKRIKIDIAITPNIKAGIGNSLCWMNGPSVPSVSNANNLSSFGSRVSRIT